MLKEWIASFKDRVTSLEEMIASVKDVIIFGAGRSGRDARRYLEERGVEVILFCDNNLKKQGTIVDSVEVIAPQRLLNHKDTTVIIASDWAGDMAMQLKNMGIERYYDLTPLVSELGRFEGHFSQQTILEHIDALEEVLNLFEDEASKKTLLSIIEYRLTMDPSCIERCAFGQYYHPYVRPEKGDTIVDAGAWVGDSCVSFAEHVDRRCRILSFEPEDRNHAILMENIEKRNLTDVVTPVKAGLWNRRCSMYMDVLHENTMLHRIDEEGTQKIELIPLDEFVEDVDGRIDLVKMDIEGAEREAIDGARESMLNDRPKLQVCIYHEVDDLWRIPIMISSMGSGYRFYMSHHSQILYDTVLYARPVQNH